MKDISVQFLKENTDITRHFIICNTECRFLNFNFLSVECLKNQLNGNIN